jgi:hypothetical protein
MSQEKSDLFAELRAAGRHYRFVRDQRDTALKACFAALTTLEARVESGTVTQAKINALDVDYECQIQGLEELNNIVEAAIDGMSSAVIKLKNTNRV